MAKRPDTAVIAATIALLAGTAGGYAISELARTGYIADLEKEIVRLKESTQQPSPVDAPSRRGKCCDREVRPFNQDLGVQAARGNTWRHVYRHHHNNVRILCRRGATGRAFLCEDRRCLGANPIVDNGGES